MFVLTSCMLSPTHGPVLQLRPGGSMKSRPRGGFKEQQRKAARERQQGLDLERSNTAAAWAAMNKALDLKKRKNICEIEVNKK